MEEARRKKRKKCTSGALGSSQLPPPPPPPSTGTSGSAQQQGSEAPSWSKTTASTPQSMAWTTSDIRYESTYVENNWTSALVSTYEPPAKNSLLAKIRDMTTFMNCYCSKFQIEECHKMLTDHVDWMNLEGDKVRINVSRPLPLGGPPGHDTIQTQFFFNKDLEYLRYGNKGSRPALSNSKMKAARYPDFGLELLVPEQIWIDEVCIYDISAAY
ncbi:hypothetical protein Tco_0069855, partial [Tanacetum coccineum]